MKSYLTSMLLTIEMITKIDGENLSDSSRQRLHRLQDNVQYISQLASQIHTPETSQPCPDDRNTDQGAKR
jgi:hypothetical protein